MQNSPMEFLKEAAIMHGIENANIVRLYGVVLDTESLMLVIIFFIMIAFFSKNYNGDNYKHC